MTKYLTCSRTEQLYYKESVMKKLTFFAVLLILASTMIFASGSQAAASGGKTEITVQVGSWWSEKIAGMKVDFEREYPQYTVRFEALPINGYFDNAAVAILAGTAPDVLDIDVTQISSFAGRNLLKDITQLVGSRVRPQDYLQSAWTSSQYEGKLYGFPSRGSGGVLYYNMTMFDEAGVPYPGDNLTYDEFLAIAMRITVPGEKYGASIAADPSDPSNVFSTFCPVLWAYKGDFLSPDGKRCLMNTPEAIQAITFWSELLTRYRVVPEGSVNFTSTRDVVPLFEQNRVAMMIHGTGGIEAFGDNPNVRFGLTQVPGGISRAGGWTLAIPVSVPDSRVNAAVDYILWYSRADVQSKHSPIEPSSIAAWDLGPPWNIPMYKQLMISSNNGKLLPSVAGWGEASRIVITELQNVLLGRKTPQQAGNDMVTQINPYL